MSKRARARIARAQAPAMKAASMRCPSSKLQARARMPDAGLKAAQHRNWPAADSTRTVSPASPPPRATAESNIQGWRRSSERSRPSFKRIVFMAVLSRACGRGDGQAQYLPG